MAENKTEVSKKPQSDSEAKKPVKETKKEQPKKETKKTAPLIKADEKIYTIPLRKALRKSERHRAPYAMRLIEGFILRHTKLQEVKIGKRLNEEVWKNGIRNIPRKVKVKVVKDGNTAKTELMGYDYTAFVAQKKKEQPKGLMDRMKGRMTPKEAQAQATEELIEGKKSKETKPAPPVDKEVEEEPKKQEEKK